MSLSKRKVGDAVLAKEVETIRALHARAKQNAKELVDIVVDIGKHLTRAKGLVGHGNWGAWLAEHFEWSEDSAERYMRLHRLVASGKIKIRTVRNLPLAAAYALAGHENLPREFFDELTRRVDAGERPAAKQVKVEIRRYSLKPPVITPVVTTRRRTIVHPMATPVETSTPSPADDEIVRWADAFQRFLEALVGIADVDKPSARMFAEGVRAGEAPAGLDAPYLREVISMLTEFVTELDGDMAQTPRLVENDKGQPMPLPQDEEESGSGSPPKSLH
jgi:hypothetical protein